MSSLEVLLRHKDEIAVKDYHSWGYRVFVLDSKLQSSQGIGTAKLDTRACAGVYLGHSLVHAGNITLVLNLQTRHMSPQYHWIFDDEFTTVPYLNLDNAPPNWASLVDHSSESATAESFNIESTCYML
eukprot:8195119-Ditylum_brightwellii.AAC.1